MSVELEQRSLMKFILEFISEGKKKVGILFLQGIFVFVFVFLSLN